MDHVRMISVPEDGLCTVLDALGPIIKGREMARRSYREHGDVGSRNVAARSMQDTMVLRWWQEACKIVGKEPDLRYW